jgi:hypothetical protein
MEVGWRAEDEEKKPSIAGRLRADEKAQPAGAPRRAAKD